MSSIVYVLHFSKVLDSGSSSADKEPLISIISMVGLEGDSRNIHFVLFVMFFCHWDISVPSISLSCIKSLVDVFWLLALNFK